MTRRAQLEIAGAVLAIAGIAFGSWLAAREARIRAEVTQAAQQVVVANAQQTVQEQKQQIESLRATIDKALANAGAAVAANKKKFAAANTPQKAADLATQVMGLPEPIRVVTPPATPQDQHPQQVAEVPLPDAPKAQEYLHACEDCKVSLDAQIKIVAAERSQLDAKDKQLAAKDQQIGAITKERDAWQKAAKGSFWQRFKGKLEDAVIFGGIGYVAGKKF